METKDRKADRKKINYFYVIILTIIIILFAGSISLSYFILKQDVITKGVYINDIDLSHLTKQQAFEKLKNSLKPMENIDIILTYNGKQYKVPQDKLKLSYNYNQMVDDAYNIGRKGNYLERLKTIYETGKKGKRLKYYMKADYANLNGYIKDIAKEIDREPVNAKISIRNGSISLTDDIPGQKADTDKVLKDIEKEVDGMIKGDIKENKAVIPIAVNMIDAKIKKSALEMIKDKVSTFSTVFNPADANRTENLAVAAKAVNGKLIMPGDKFSLNKTLGPRIIENGYTEAPVIINNKLEPGIGGGICQVATTLYNAVLRADLKVDERYHHAFPVGYIQPGQDATISGDALDLKFENQLQYPIYIESYITNNKFIVNLYGYSSDKSKRIEIYSEIVETYTPKIVYIDDPTMDEGKQQVEVQEHTGYKVNTYKLIYKNNVLVNKEFLYTDVYDPVDGVVKRGTKKTSVTVKPAS
jgi:vancomycin resistance protein YoaR